MKKILHLLILIGLCLTSVCMHAQENVSRQIFNQAESEYGVGRIEQAIQLLQDHLDDFDGALKQSAYRLLALCYLSEDKDKEARYYAERLIKLNNYYNSADDPARFQDLVSQLKEGITTTITTASNQSETINEAPGPITIITAEMIDDLGYNKSLGQILAAYVPGMAEMTPLEEGVNMSMHSAYASGQELILIMENGHRLNTRFDNNGPTSYSISTEKIDHIEVLRGPASSLYGNVALSAVVNIITKSGRSINGVRARYGYGTYNTHKADFEMGTQFMDADIYGWASVYMSDGDIRHFGDGGAYMKDKMLYYDDYGYAERRYYALDKMYIDAYKDAPAYDVGLTFRVKGFDVMFSKKNVKKVLQNTSFHGGYNYDRYYAVEGMKPGKGFESTHTEIGYTRQLGNLYLNALFYSDWYSPSTFDVSSDSVVTTNFFMEDEDNTSPNSANVKGKDREIRSIEIENGSYHFRKFDEHTMGGYFRAGTDYRLSKMKGNVLMGGQYERFLLQTELSFWGLDYSEIYAGTFSDDDLIKSGKEENLSFFIQDKHYFLPQLILNAGFRYDIKYRQQEDPVNTFSPRLALLYVPNDRFSLKLSYSEAFADLSFYYRYIMKSDYTSSEPQHLSALQLTAMGSIPSSHLKYEMNLFYNKYSHLLCWQDRDDYVNTNKGKLTNVGAEVTARYAYKRLSASLLLYYCYDASAESYYYNKSKKLVYGVPHFTVNLHAGYFLLQGKTHELKVDGHATYTGKKMNYSEMAEDDFYVDSSLLLDLGIKYRYKKRLQLSLDGENIFDTDHYICGPNYQYAPKLQRGRSLMASIAYQF